MEDVNWYMTSYAKQVGTVDHYGGCVGIMLSAYVAAIRAGVLVYAHRPSPAPPRIKGGRVLWGLLVVLFTTVKD